MQKLKELMNKPVTAPMFIAMCILWVIVQVTINTKMLGLW